jgi:hypothetical protein
LNIEVWSLNETISNHWYKYFFVEFDFHFFKSFFDIQLDLLAMIRWVVNENQKRWK